VAKFPDSSPTTWRITYQYTTDQISGSAGGEPEFYTREADALKRYLNLKQNGLAEEGAYARQLDSASVTLCTIADWQQVLP
jgi:hypothetical protein